MKNMYYTTNKFENVKSFEISAHSNNLEAYFEVKTYDEAQKIFERLIDSDVYERVYLTDAFTGELYAHYNKTSDESGTEVSLWFAN